MQTARVLLADDHAVVRSGISNALRELAQVQVVGEVGDGPALMAALEQLAPDVLLLDITMPDFEPISAIQEIRARYPALRILVVSAYDDDVYVQGLLGAGVNGYHLKDQPLEDLRLAVQRVIAGERWISTPLMEKLRTSPSAPDLTPRQIELLQLLAEGLDNYSIGQRVGLSVKTIENHLTRIYRELDVQSRLEALTYVLQHPHLLQGARQAAPAAPRVTVLVVDDNERYRQQLRRTISRVAPHMQVVEAGTTIEAQTICQRDQPRLALVDVVLGDESGIECARRLRMIDPALRIVLISAYPDREFHHQGLAVGAAAFLDKKDLDTATIRQVLKDV